MKKLERLYRAIFPLERLKFRIEFFFLRLQRDYHAWMREGDYELYGYLYEKRKAATGTYFAVLILEDGKIINCEMKRNELIECGIEDIWRDDLLKVSFHMDGTGWIKINDIQRVESLSNIRKSRRLWRRISHNSFYVRCRFRGNDSYS